MTDDKEENNKLKDYVLRDIYYNKKQDSRINIEHTQQQRNAYPISHLSMSKSGSVGRKGNNSNHTRDSTLILSIHPTKRLLLIWLISAVTLSTIGVMVIFLLLWTLLLSLHGQSL